MKVWYWLSGLFTLLAIFIFVVGLISATGAPQQAAVSAMAIATALFPYILFKLESGTSIIRNQKRIIELLEKQNSKE